MVQKTTENPGKILIIFFAILAIIAFLAIGAVSPAGGVFVLACLALLILFIIFPQFGLYLTVLALPLINWNFYIKGLIVPAVDVIAALALVAFLIKTAYSRLFGTHEQTKWPFFKFFIAFFAVALLSAFFSDDVWSSIWYAVRWILFFYLAYIVVPFNSIANGKILRRTIIYLLVSVSAVGLMGVASLFFQDWQNTFVRISPITLFGVYVIGDNQNLIAEYLVVAVFGAWALAYWRPVFASRNKWLTVLTVILALIAIATFSRAAWIALAFQGFIYFLAQARKIRSVHIMPVIFALIILIPLGVYMTKIQNEYSIGISSTENRWLMTQIAARAWANNPFFGNGSGTFIALIENNIRFRAQYGEALDSHGLWQKVMAENGTFGVITLAAFIFAIFYYLWRALEQVRNTGEFRLLLALTVAAAGGLLFQFFNTSYYKGKVWLPIAIALAAAHLIKEQRLQYGPRKKD